MTSEQAEEILTLLRNLDGRMETVESKLGSLEADQKLIRTELQAQGGTLGLILTQSRVPEPLPPSPNSERVAIGLMETGPIDLPQEVPTVDAAEDLFGEATLDDPNDKH